MVCAWSGVNRRNSKVFVSANISSFVTLISVRDQNRSGGTNFASNFGPHRANMVLRMRHRCFSTFSSPSPSSSPVREGGTKFDRTKMVLGPILTRTEFDMTVLGYMLLCLLEG